MKNRAMKNRAMKITALSLCAAVILGTAGTSVRALAAGGTEGRVEEKAVEANAAEGKATETMASEGKPADVAADKGLTKDETVYVLAGADGAVQKIIVSDWIRNADGVDVVNDSSELSGIETVKGEGGYTLGGDNTYVWDARGGDVYYQGNIEKELPVELAVTYKLDGKTISPDELAGKSGKVTIRFDYTNRQYEYVEIDGKKEKIYVPFAMLTAMLLDNEVFTNVEVSNGKLINDGDRTVVVGVAFPGLQEDLAIDSEKLELPDYVEITADVTDFELGMTVTLATNELFSKGDVGELDSVGDLNESLGELTDAMEQLMDGSSRLYDGLCTLLDKSGELVEGIDKLAAGAKALSEGVGDLDEGASRLQAGAAQLSSGLSTLSSNNDAVNGGARQVFETLLSTANTQLSAAGLSVPAMTISNYADVLNGVIASLDENAVYKQALSTVTAAVEEQRSYIMEQVTAAIRARVTEQVIPAVEEQVKLEVTEAVRENVTAQVITAATGMDKESYDAAVAAGMVDSTTQAAIQGAIDAQMQGDDVRQLVETNTAAQMESENVQAIIAAKTEEQMQDGSIQDMIAANTEQQVQKAIADNMASDAVRSQLAAASEGAKTVMALKASLDSYNSFYIGLQNYTVGVAQAASGAADLRAGADSLKDGADKLCSGASELYDGILTLKDGAPTLVDGITQLRDGAMQLSDGLKEFDEEGVQKLVEAVDGDLDGLVTRIRATVDVSKDYQLFSGAGSDMDGQVKFIYRTESIEAD